MLAIARESDLPASAIDSLSPAERARAGGRQSARRRRQFVGGRFLLRSLLERVTGQPGASHEIHAAASGKPRCTNGIAVSIAHSGNLIVCAAAAHGEVGVDVERIDPRRDWGRLARDYFSSAERAWMAGRPQDDFHGLWVLKEAWLKMRGTGLAGGLSCLQCRIEPPVIEALTTDGGAGPLSLLACTGAFVGLATDRGDHKNLILLAWRSQAGRLEPATEVVWLAGGHAAGAGAAGSAGPALCG